MPDWRVVAARLRPGVLAVGGILALTAVLTTVVLVVTNGPSVVLGASKVSPYIGLATWVDMYDWTAKFGGGTARLRPEAVDQMAEQGVQTLAIQATATAPGEILERSTLEAWMSQAEEQDLQVVLWYLPTFADTAGDIRTLSELDTLEPDGIGVNIESKVVTDVPERSRRLVQLSRQLRDAVPGTPLQAIVLSPTYLEQVTPAAWPGFPWAELKGVYDVWSPMAYWTDRRTSSGLRDATRYTNANLARIRELLDDPQVPVHMVGGVGDQATTASVREFTAVVQAEDCIGASLYDWRTTTAAHWAELTPIRV